MSFTRPLLLASLLLRGGAAGAETPEHHFLGRVQPLLDSRCVSCHGPDKVKGGLRLDSREALLAGGDSGPALVPGQPSDSLILQAVMHAKPDLEMPPKEKLTAQDIAVLERWIATGAPWPEAALAASVAPAAPGERLGDAWSDPRNPIVRVFGGQRLDLWSFQPVRPVAPPAGGGPHPVDRFLPAGPEADARTLVRRLSFDLTGLPPTPGEVEAFVAEHAAERRRGVENRRTGKRESGTGGQAAVAASAPPAGASSSALPTTAYERLVDRLLASPRYGEHQARQWLDVVRYSDSNGFDWDEFRPQAWRFRDYVVRAFNADKPFDQFIREQLAGDELLAGPPESPAEQDRLIATGYLRLGPQDNSASLFNEQDRARAEWMADLTETTGSAFLAMTLSCCRCHDHKYDPLSQADHFRLRAFFEPLKRADDLPLDLAAEQREITRQHGEIEARLKPLAAERDQLFAAAKGRARAERVQALSEDERRLLAMAAAPQSEKSAPAAAELAKKVEPSDEEAKKAFTEEEKMRFQALGEEVAGLRKQKRPFTQGLLATDMTDKVPATRVLKGGDHQAPAEEVGPGFLSALDPNPAIIRAAAGTHTTGRRLTLADWIASPENPLTPRVQVNRVWQGL
ncbi:MAG TPA: DUF1549 domain-containing protein, partial [Verrucomicrobiota bacterium]|nr:DUF1549 domain-containing protein [Verrucomicrobiota bacterium]